MKRCILDIETTSLEPWNGRIVVIGIKGIYDKEATVFFDEDEKQLLEDFLMYYHKSGFDEIIGYNISFDIRFIFGRCLKHNVKTNGIFKSFITDIMWIMKSVVKSYSYNRPGKLEEWLECIFDSGKIPIPDSVGEMYEQGKISEIIQYNKWDVEMTWRLWWRIQKVLGNGE